MLIPAQNTIKLHKAEMLRDGRWTLAGILAHTIANHGHVYCPRNYALAEIVQQCAITYSISNFSAPHLLRYTTPAIVGARRQAATFLPEKTAGPNWIYLFDLGDSSHVRREVKQRSHLRDAISERIRHDLDIPVGVGFNLFMLPWLLEESRWAKLTNVVEGFRAALSEPLKAIGVSVERHEPTLAKVVSIRKFG
jgi:hypothetical protein